MADRVVKVIGDNVADTHLVSAAGSAGVATNINTLNTMMTSAVFTNGKILVLTQTVAASAFTPISATQATMRLNGTIPEGAVIYGVILAVGTAFNENVSCTLQVGDSNTARRYHSAPVNIFGTSAATALGAYQGSQFQGGIYGGGVSEPKLTITTASAVSLVIAGGGSLTISIYYLPTQFKWCCDSTQFLNHELFFPKTMGTCLTGVGGIGTKQTKLTDAEGKQVAAWIDYYFAMQVNIQTLTPVSTLTAASKYVLITEPFTLEPYATIYSISALGKIVDGYALGYSLSLPHYTILPDQFDWISKAFDAMDFAQTLIRNNFVNP